MVKSTSGEVLQTMRTSYPQTFFYNRLGHSCWADWGYRGGKTASDHSHIQWSLRSRVLLTIPRPTTILSIWIPHPRLWPHSSSLFSPEIHPSSPLSLPGLWPFHDQIYFTPDILPPEARSLNPASCLWLSHPLAHISNFQHLVALVLWALSPFV